MIRKNTTNGNWGLDRIDQFHLPLNNTYVCSRSGSNVDVCVVSTGIAKNHSEFSLTTVNTLYDFRNSLSPSNTNYVNQNSIFYGYDDHGLGTFLSSIITGLNHGVATKANLYSVKVFDQNLNFNIEHLFESLDKILDFHLHKPVFRPTILCLPFSDINYSLILKNKIKQLYDSGIIIIGSAGNKGINVENSFPANLEEVIAIAGSDFNDNFMNPAQLSDPSFSHQILYEKGNSNFGEKIFVIAPGFRIKGAWIPKNINPLNIFQGKIYDTNIISGNSVACAFVVGVACLYFQENPYASSLDFKEFIKKTSSKNVLKINREFSSTPNRLLRMPYTNVSITWSIEDNSFLGVFNEGDEINEKIESNIVDVTGRRIKPTYKIISGSLPPGVSLHSDGTISGKISSINNYFPGYNSIKNLPPLEQQLYSKNQIGYVDFTFTILAEYDFISSTRNLKIRVIDLNDPPVWYSDNILDINTVYPSAIFYYKNFVDIDISNNIIDSNNDNIQFTILNNILPPNLTLTVSGRIKGTVESIFPSSLNYPISSGLIEKNYYFTIRATDGYEKTDKWFKLTVYRNNINNSPPQILTNNLSNLGDFIKGIPLFINIEVNDNDSDNIQLIEVSADLSGLNISSNIFFGLPKGLKITRNGIEGIIDSSVPIGDYYFGIAAFDGWDEDRKTFFLSVREISVTAFNSFINLQWITTSGSLGYIYEFYPSYFSVKGISIDNSPIKYKLVSTPNSLPPGLMLDEDTGLIKGITGYVSADKTFNFIIEIYKSNEPSISLARKFSITVKKIWGRSISEFHYYLRSEEKFLIQNFILSRIQENDLIPKDILYRFGDENYDKSIDPKIFIISGTEIFNDQQLFDIFNVEKNSPTKLYKSYFRPLNVRLGNFKNAVVRDFSGNLISEIIYIEVYDENENTIGVDASSKIVYMNPNSNHPMDEFYVSNIETWRNKIKLDGGLVNNKEKLPLWMISPQLSANSTDALGYTMGIELFYVKIGTSRNITFSLNQRFRNEIYGKKIIIDSLVYEEIDNLNKPKKRIIKFPPGDYKY